MRGSRETADPEGAAHPLHTAALLCAVAAPLVLASVLEIETVHVSWLEQPAPAVEQEPEPYAPAPLERTTAALEPPASTTPRESRLPESTVPPARRAEPPGLASRASDDARRLRSDGAFTLQFAVLCRDDGVRQLLVDLEADPAFYVLPATVEGRSCYRLCYGSYASQAAARAASAVPDSLLRLTAQPRVVRSAEVTP